MKYIMFLAFLKGLSVSLGFIVAIGVQNSFVLRQGILRNNILLVVLICSIIEAIMIIIGVKGLGAIITSSSLLIKLTRWGGALFLFYYGTKSFLSAQKPHSMNIDNAGKILTIEQTVKMTLVFSLLNPKVYLDNCVLIGDIGAHLPKFEQIAFILGAIIASSSWFFALGFGARYLKDFFANPVSWKILDSIIGVIMYITAMSLVYAL